MSYEALFEEEGNIFGGTPSGKFFDIMRVGNQNLVEDEITNIMQRLAAMEILLTETFGECDEWEDKMILNDYDRKDELASKTKSLFIEHTGNIVTRNE